jgi:probable F420-dependent oxidoreductase
MTRMQLSLALPVSGAWATPQNVADVARAADAHGFRGVWTFQRWLADDSLASVYRSVLDPLVTLGFAAAVTQRVRLGLAVVNGPFYSPVALAKQFAAVDVLSTGRLDAGVGLGWAPYEYAAAGVPMAGRGRRFDEWLDCVHVALTEDPVEFSGEFYTVPRANIGPMPVQRPRPPLLIGGSAPTALRRAGAKGDGWISSSRASMTDVRAAVQVVRAAAEQAGKARDAVRCVVRGVTSLREAAVDGDRAALTGSLDQLRDDLAAYAALDVDEVFLDLNFDSARVGNPDADPAVALDLLAQILPLGAETF